MTTYCEVALSGTSINFLAACKRIWPHRPIMAFPKKKKIRYPSRFFKDLKP